MRRRALLSALGATAVGFAGCLDRGPSVGPAPGAGGSPDSTTTAESDATETDATTTGDTTTTSTDTPETTTETSPSRFVRCEGEPVWVERAVTDEPGYDEDDMEYYPENETVRYVAARSGDSPVSFETTSFDEWASIEAAKAALERLRGVTADRLRTDEFGSGMGVPPEFTDMDDVVVRLTVSTRVEDDETVSTPSVSRDQLADAAPRSVEATVSLESEEFSRTVPVFARHVETGAG